MEIKMDRKEWRKRFKYRMDLSSRITHLTKGGDEAFDNLINILEEKRIKGSTRKSGFICGEIPAVCLQDAPLSAIAENLQYEEVLKNKIFRIWSQISKRLYLSTRWTSCNI